jgi:hypothetical protein
MRKKRVRRKRKTTGNLTASLRKLIEEWRLAILNENERRCDVCGCKRKNRIHIHHTKAFHIVRDEVFAELELDMKLNIEDYTPEEIQLISDKLVEKHKAITGVPMYKGIHKLFHKIYGMNATIEDYYEFKKRYNNGEWKVKIY